MLKTQLAVKLSEATENDRDLIVHWRNDPETRSQSRRKHLLTWADLADAPNGGKRKTYLARSNDEPIGYMHIDVHGDTAELSWVIAPSCRGKGFGTTMVGAALKETGCSRLIAEIRPGNLASIAIAKRLGFELIEEKDDLLVWQTSRR